MKKGIYGLVIGLIFFFIAFGFATFNSGSSTNAIYIPFIFVSIFITIVGTIVKKTSEQTTRPKRHYDDKDYFGKDNLVPCVDCHKLIDKDFKYCPDCGAPQKDTIICQYCGHENPKSNALCEKCNGFL